jgi:hypothetical protein
MDDYSINSLTESKNEWCARLVNILTHSIVQGIKSIFNEATKLCEENDEDNKYLMTFQNLLSTIPTWNPITIENERKRIETASGCKYLEDLVTCVHIIQLKALTCIRVGQKQKKIDIDIPSIDKFIHQIYVNTARKLYTNIYLFEKDIFPLQVQKNNRELELLIKEAILITIRDNIPVEQILRVYMEETEEHEVVQTAPQDPKPTSESVDPSKNSVSDQSTDEKLEALAEQINTTTANTLKDPNTIETETPKLVEKEVSQTAIEENTLPIPKTTIDFSDIDNIIDSTNKEHEVSAPKDLETLDKIATINNEKRAQEEKDENEEESDGGNIKLSIGDDIKLDMDTINLSADPILGNIEEL